MYKIFTALKRWLTTLLEPAPQADPLIRMTPSELADLPVHHPLGDPSSS